MRLICFFIASSIILSLSSLIFRRFLLKVGLLIYPDHLNLLRHSRFLFLFLVYIRKYFYFKLFLDLNNYNCSYSLNSYKKKYDYKYFYQHLHDLHSIYDSLLDKYTISLAMNR